MTHLRPYEAKLMEHREAFPLDRETHAATWTNWDGNLVSAHGHIDRAQEKLENMSHNRLDVIIKNDLMCVNAQIKHKYRGCIY